MSTQFRMDSVPGSLVVVGDPGWLCWKKWVGAVLK